MKPLRILIVEDDEPVARGLALTLSAAGHRVLGVEASAVAAIAEAEETRPDLAIVDLHLAGEITGVDVAQALWVRWAIPVLFLTADPAVGRIASAWALGHLEKPASGRTVVGAVDYVARLRAGSTTRSPPRGLEVYRNWLIPDRRSIGA